MTDAAAADRKALRRAAHDPATTPQQLQACAGRGEAIDRLLARHPNASAQMPAQLSHSNGRTTRKAVKPRPNAPEENRPVSRQAMATAALKATGPGSA